MANTEQQAYNTPRVLGNVYNTVSFNPDQRENPDGTWIPITYTMTDPAGLMLTAGTPALSGAVTGSNLRFDISSGAKVQMRKANVNEIIKTPVTVNTPTVGDLPGHSFTYAAFTACTIGVGLPFVIGSHTKICFVGDYVSWGIAPDALTFPGGGEIIFDLAGDVTPGLQNSFGLDMHDSNGQITKSSGLTMRKTTNEENGRQSLLVFGYAATPGLYRFTLQMTSRMGEIKDRSGGAKEIEGDSDNESFLLLILPKGPQPGDLMVVNACPGVVEDALPELRFRLVAFKNSSGSALNEILNLLLSSTDIDSAAFTYHDAVWGDTTSSHTHARGYWTLDVNIPVPQATVSVYDAHFVLSRDTDKWRMYIKGANPSIPAWKVMATAPLRTTVGTVLTPFCLHKATSSEPDVVPSQYRADILAKGDQRHYATSPELSGVFSTCGEDGGETYFSQEPGESTFSGDSAGLVLWQKGEDHWVVASTLESSSTDVEVQSYPGVATIFCPPKYVQNHGGVGSADAIIAISAPVDTSSGGTVNPQPAKPVAAATTISNAEPTSLLKSHFYNMSNDFVMGVLQELDDAPERVAGYMWVRYYPLLRMVNFLTALLYVKVGGSCGNKTELTTIGKSESISGERELPTDPSAYYTATNGGIIIRNYKADYSSSYTSTSSSTKASWSDNQSSSFTAWTGSDGFFKMVGWRPPFVNGTVSCGLKISGQYYTEHKETAATIVPVEWVFERAHIEYSVSHDVEPPAEYPCVKIEGGDDKLTDTDTVDIVNNGTTTEVTHKHTAETVDTTGVDPTAEYKFTGGGGSIIYDQLIDSDVKLGCSRYYKFDATTSRLVEDSTLTRCMYLWHGYTADIVTQTNDKGQITLGARYTRGTGPVNIISTGCGAANINKVVTYSEYDSETAETCAAEISINLTLEGEQPTITFKTKSTTTTDNINPFDLWFTWSCAPDGSITINTVPPYWPGNYWRSSGSPAGGDTSTLTAKFKDNDGNPCDVTVTYTRKVKTSGSFLASKTITYTSGGSTYAGCLLAWPALSRFTTNTFRSGGSGTASLSTWGTDGKQRWVAANAVVMDGPRAITSGAALNGRYPENPRTIYMAPAGHGGFSLSADGYYICHIRNSERKYTKTCYLDSTTYPGVYTLVSSVSYPPNSYSVSTTDEHFGGSIGIGFSLCGGLVELPAVSGGHQYTAIGTQHSLTSDYSGVATVSTPSGEERAGTTAVTAGYHYTSSSSNDTGIRGSSYTSSGGEGTGVVDGETRPIQSFAAAKSLVGNVTMPTVQGGWDANGRPIADAVEYYKSERNVSSSADPSMTVGLTI